MHRPDVGEVTQKRPNVRGGPGTWAPVCGRHLPCPSRRWLYAVAAVRGGDLKSLLAVGLQDLCLGHVGWVPGRTNTAPLKRD